jgi:pyruvate,water dikinase
VAPGCHGAQAVTALRGRVLTADLVTAVAHFGAAVEHHVGRPQQIEFAIEGHQIWLVRTRPVTPLPEALQAPTAWVVPS